MTDIATRSEQLPRRVWDEQAAAAGPVPSQIRTRPGRCQIADGYGDGSFGVFAPFSGLNT